MEGVCSSGRRSNMVKLWSVIPISFAHSPTHAPYLLLLLTARLAGYSSDPFHWSASARTPHRLTLQHQATSNSTNRNLSDPLKIGSGSFYTHTDTIPVTYQIPSAPRGFAYIYHHLPVLLPPHHPSAGALSLTVKSYLSRDFC